ncbi:MAG: hypothetical protein CL498_03330 [Actinobacteria bacterium]|jgi:hypothetical protein|nr:hypothetical protein [Actinomycetota bacterium]|tara:strand:- start:2766 stop:3173 length:408 start_codon:yes stop_codon:yes gene_type:complete
MASLSSIRSGLSTRLATISGLSVYSYVPDSIEPPTAVVGVMSSVDYDSTMSRGSDSYEIPLYLYVSRVDAELSQDSLDEFLAGSGSSSIKQAIEGDSTLGGVVSSARVVEASNYGVYTINSIDYLGVEFSVEIIT